MGSDISYGDALEQIGISTLAHTRRDMCNKIFNYIVNNPNHKLYNLLLISNNKFGISFTRLYIILYLDLVPNVIQLSAEILVFQ